MWLALLAPSVGLIPRRWAGEELPCLPVQAFDEDGERCRTWFATRYWARELAIGVPFTVEPLPAHLAVGATWFEPWPPSRARVEFDVHGAIAPWDDDHVVVLFSVKGSTCPLERTFVFSGERHVESATRVLGRLDEALARIDPDCPYAVAGLVEPDGRHPPAPSAV